MPPEEIVALAMPAVQTGGNILSTLLTNRSNRKLAEYSFDMQRQMVREQNEYNSPIQQMARYQEAGLNPNLIYGNGQSSAGNQSEIARYQAPVMHAPEIELGSMMNMGLQALRQKAEIRNIEKQGNLIDAEAAATWENFASKQRENVMQNLLYGGFNPIDDPRSFMESQGYQSLVADAQYRQYRNQYEKASAAAEELSVKEKEFIVNTRNKYEEQYLSLRNKGETINNALNEIRLELNEDLRKFGGERGANLVWSVVRFLLMSIR